MSEKIKSMISNIASKDFVAAREDFNALILSKVGDAMDQAKLEVAATIYNGVEATEAFKFKTKGDDDDKSDEDDDDEDDSDSEDDDEKDMKKKKSKEDDVEEGKAPKIKNRDVSVKGMAKAAEKEAGKTRRRAPNVKQTAREEAELDELSNKTLGSYAKKSANDVANKSHKLGTMDARQSDQSPSSSYKKNARKTDNRVTGIGRAVDRMSK